MSLHRAPSKNMNTDMNESLIDIDDNDIVGIDRVPNFQPIFNSNLNFKNNNGTYDKVSNSENAENMAQLQNSLMFLVNKCEQLQAQLSSQTPDSNSNRHIQSVEKGETFKVSTRVPPFYSDKPDLWFHQVEAQFRNNHITRDQTKYDIVVSNLDPKYLDIVAHIIRDPPNENKYDLFKSTLIKEYQLSDEKRLTQLLQGIDLGDQKPSALLRKMREVSKGIVNEQVLETLWSSKLPETVRAIIVSINIGLEEKAQAADKILDRVKFEISATDHEKYRNGKTVNQTHELALQIAALSKQLEALNKKVNNSSFQSPSRFQSRSQSRSRHNRNTNNNTNKTDEKKYDQCWYHFKFNDNAIKCTDWCKYNPKFNEKQKN